MLVDGELIAGAAVACAGTIPAPDPTTTPATNKAKTTKRRINQSLDGLREDTESMHNDYKSRLVNRRAGSVGLARREMDIRGYQMFQMVVALMAWKIRTGGDVSEFLGQWEPPERARRRNDA